MSVRRQDPRLADAKAIPPQEMVDRLGIAGLRRNGNELSGPCPHCGDVGHRAKSGPPDRFNVNLRSGAFLCRQCDMRGGDVVALVQQVLGLQFLDALSWICGDKPAQLDEAQMAERRRRAAAAEHKRQDEANRYRARAIADAHEIWNRSVTAEGTLVRDYLAARGIHREMMPDMPRALRFIPQHRYVKKIDGKVHVLWKGPAMIAGILSPRGEITAVHQTWIDPKPPHGKMKVHYAGEPLPEKMVRGSKKGGAIRLTGELGNFHTLVMAEGIETTLSAQVALDREGWAFWAGVDLGNMAGIMQRVLGKRHSGLPDMTDAAAFVPPPGLQRLIFVQDGDSDPKATRAKLLSGLRRALAHFPDLRAQIVHAGEGVDLNDVLTGAVPEKEDTAPV